MWSNISAPKSGLKAAQVGHQLQPKQVLDQHHENTASTGGSNESEPIEWGPGRAGGPEARPRPGAPLMRYKHAVCASASNGFIYIHGGRFGNGIPLDDDVWRFDPHENSWLQLETGGCNKPPSLQEHTLVEHREQLYMFGGQVSAASGQENSFWRLDLKKAEWFSLNPRSSMKFGAYLGPSNRRGHSACVYRDSMYIFGGYEDFRGSCNQLWQFDLLNERWELRNLSSSSACHPEARHSHSAIVHGDSMYIYGGLSNLKPLGDLWRWSWRDKRWYKERTRGQSPGALHGHSAIQAFGSMFVFGGERASGRTTRSLWRLNLSNLCWQKIKTKGPRPNPSTWHVAIANPMSVLDEANYLIEGESSDCETDQPAPRQHQRRQPPPDELMALVDRQQSASDNDGCFSPADNNHEKPQTIPMGTFRPVSKATGNNHHGPQAAGQRPQSGSKLLISHSKSFVEQTNCSAAPLKPAANQLRDRSKAKRRLRLSFLRRNKKKSAAGADQAGGTARQMPSSWSAISNLGAGAGGGACVSRSNSLVAQHKLRPAGCEQNAANQSGAEDAASSIEMDVEAQPADESGLTNGHLENNVGILESLDSDIKEMFQRAMSPAETEANDSIEALRRETSATSRLLDANLARDSVTQSELSSWLAGANSTQTYQTAREQLTSQSTLTITPRDGAPNAEHHQQVVAANQASGQQPIAGDQTSSRLADVRQRRSMQHFSNQQARRNSRPKSEILQSLIDRADARIKHLYTPYFNLDAPHNHQQRPAGEASESSKQQQQRAKFNSNDPLLGALANHRMFERQPGGALEHGEAHGQPAQTRAPASGKHRRPHTIHQTMTYYNLYFSEESARQRALDAQQPQHSRGEAQLGADFTQSSSNSTSAALVGVRDGTTTTSSSGGGGGDGSQRTGRLLGSEVSSLVASSESRTLCDLNGDTDERHEFILSARNGPMEPCEPDGSHRWSASETGGDEPRPHQQQQQQQHLHADEQQQLLYSNSRGLSDPLADNTSLSFSVIAEFEEDDMLQYSSPTDPKIQQAQPGPDEHDDEYELEDDDADYYGRHYADEEADEDEELAAGRRFLEDHDLRAENQQADDAQRRPGDGAADAMAPGKQLIAQKSTSSGYDSIKSSSNNGFVKREAGAGQHQQHHEYSTSSSLQTGASSSPGHTSDHNNSNNNNFGPAERAAGSRGAATHASLATADSLTTTSESLALTPPSKSLPSSPPDVKARAGSKSIQNSSSFASSLMSGPSRFFGKKKTKTRYWQLCMFVLGGKQQGGHHAHGNPNEPISIWRLYI